MTSTSSENAMSLMTQAYLLEKYGPRLGMEQLAQVLHVGKSTLFNQLTAGTCPVRTYLEGHRRFADYRDVADHLEALRRQAA